MLNFLPFTLQRRSNNRAAIDTLQNRAAFFPITTAIQSALGGDYRVEDARNSPTLQALVSWLNGALAESTLQVTEDGEPLDAPNAFLDSIDSVSPGQWRETFADLYESGNALWEKLSGVLSPVRSYRLIPWSSVSKVENGVYELADGSTRYMAEQVVHFRALSAGGISRAPLAPARACLVTDSFIHTWINGNLRGRPNLGVFVSPAGTNQSFDMPQVDVAPLVQAMNAARNAAVQGADFPVALQQLAYDNSQTDLAATLYEVQAAICALVGIAPAVVPLGVGLARSTYSNYETARKVSFENGVLPLQSIIAHTLQEQVLVDFYGTGNDLRVEFNNDEVAALQESKDALSTRVISQFSVGLLSLREARVQLGYTAEVEADMRDGDDNGDGDDSDSSNDDDSDSGETSTTETRALFPMTRQNPLADSLSQQLEPQLEAFYLEWQRVLQRELSGDTRTLPLGQLVSIARRAALEQQITLRTLLTTFYTIAAPEAVAAAFGGAIRVPLSVIIPALVEAEVQRFNLPRQAQRAAEQVSAGTRQPSDLGRGTHRTIADRAKFAADNTARNAVQSSQLEVADTNALWRARDNQTNYNDEECTARDGQVYSTLQAKQHLASEHPNGTLEFELLSDGQSYAGGIVRSSG